MASRRAALITRLAPSGGGGGLSLKPTTKRRFQVKRRHSSSLGRFPLFADLDFRRGNQLVYIRPNRRFVCAIDITPRATSLVTVQRPTRLAHSIPRFGVPLRGRRPTRTCCGTPAALPWPTRGTTRDRCKPTSGTKTFSTRSVIPTWRRAGLKTSGADDQAAQPRPN
jgi:hypothetical protein